MSLPRQLHAASLPFVTRALRGGRKLRYTGVALLLTLLSVVLGAWLALGDGPLEHDMRVGFRLERHKHVQEQLEFKVFADDPSELREYNQALRELSREDNLRATARAEFVADGYIAQRVQERMRDGIDVLARTQNNLLPLPAAAQADADALVARLRLYDLGAARDWNRWSDEELREQLGHVVARGLLPEVTVYSSPLSYADALGVIGLVAGSVVMLLLMLFAPVLAGTQMAQEVHENTLQPLTGTALSARDLVLGMTLGPAAVIALLAAPQVVLLLAAALAVGHVGPALGLLAVSLVSGAFLTMLAQLAGLALGRSRGSNMLGVTLLSILAPLTLLGAIFALELPRQGLGVLALLPEAAASHMLLESFVPAGVGLRAPSTSTADLAHAGFVVTAGTLGMLCFAYLGLRALERRIGELSRSALTRGEALLGALVSTALIILANPWRDHGGNFYLVNFALVLVPMAILLMMRVPLAETPTALRRIPIAGLLAEFFAGFAVFFAACAACMGPGRLDVLGSPVALAYLLWTITVAGLLTIRVTALPMSMLAKLWASVCTLGLMVGYVHVVDWTRSPGFGRSVLLFSDVSPFLGLLQAVLLVLIPVMLVRALRHPASTTPREA